MTIRSKQKLVSPKPFNIVLVEPEIPPNTGNIARLCAATSSRLHLVHPLGFKIDDSKLKRAGLDYWHLLDITEYENWDKFYSANFNQTKSNFWFLSTRGEKNIWDVEFNPGDYLIFGSETRGLDEKIINSYMENTVSIPMNGKTRSVNLATSVGIVLYEALRQSVVKKQIMIQDIGV